MLASPEAMRAVSSQHNPVILQKMLDADLDPNVKVGNTPLIVFFSLNSPEMSEMM